MILAYFACDVMDFCTRSWGNTRPNFFLTSGTLFFYNLFSKVFSVFKVKNMAYKNYVFTLNNWTVDNDENLRNYYEQTCSFIIFGKEIAPTTGTPHLQGYIQLEKRTRLKTILKWWKNTIHGAPHIERAKGSAKQNEVYCGKTDKIPFVGGTASAQGKRTDVEAFLAAAQTETTLDLIADFPLEYAKWNNAAREAKKERQKADHLADLKAEFLHSELREWQERILKRILNQSDRTVLWVWESEGGKGKTYLAKYLVAKEDAFYVRNGKSSDIAYAYNYEPMVVFDFTRTKEGCVNYEIIEAFKDGMIFSPKYQSTQKVFTPPKVVCFANWLPDITALSQDRWDLQKIN